MGQIVERSAMEVVVRRVKNLNVIVNVFLDGDTLISNLYACYLLPIV